MSAFEWIVFAVCLIFTLVYVVVLKQTIGKWGESLRKIKASVIMSLFGWSLSLVYGALLLIRPISEEARSILNDLDGQELLLAILGLVAVIMSAQAIYSDIAAAGNSRRKSK